jgi:hypothetical protein
VERGNGASDDLFEHSESTDVKVRSVRTFGSLNVAPAIDCPGALGRVKTALRRCAVLTRPARSRLASHCRSDQARELLEEPSSWVRFCGSIRRRSVKVCCNVRAQSSGLSKSKNSASISYKYNGCLTTPIPRSIISSAIAPPSSRRIVIAPFL